MLRTHEAPQAAEQADDPELSDRELVVAALSTLGLVSVGVLAVTGLLTLLRHLLT